MHVLQILLKAPAYKYFTIKHVFIIRFRFEVDAGENINIQSSPDLINKH